jgi:hypothetical protein
MGILDNLRHKPERSPSQGGNFKDRITPGKADVGDSTTRPREVPLPKDEPGGLSGPAPLPKR